MFAKKQTNLLLFRGLQRCVQSAPCTACPLRHERQALLHNLDNLRITAVECHSQEISAIIGPRFSMEIGSAREKQTEHLEIAVHCCCHQGRKTFFIGEVDERASIDEPPCCLPILLRCRD